jgi:hypothetical protein
MGVRWEQLAVRKDEVERAIQEHEANVVPRLEKLWAYYRNPIRATTRASVLGVGLGGGLRTGRGYVQAQESGLPSRSTGSRHTEVIDDRARATREIVIENDIGWRVQAMVDFVFGKPVLIQSMAKDEATREVIEKVLDHVWERSGGIALLQDFGTLGHVYGHVDAMLRIDDRQLLAAGAGRTLATSGGTGADSIEDLLAVAGACLKVEIVEPTRGTAVLDERDYRRLRAYAVRTLAGQADASRDHGLLSRIARLMSLPANKGIGGSNEILEIITPDGWDVYEAGELVWSRERDLIKGELPVVHVQNISQPFEYEGLSEVEALIPLQDELNTRLSDRASRVTLQSFKMYLAKGIEGFDRVAVGPGQVWYTDNMQASIESFGGDGSSPSEESHIREVREAMDKVSGVPPLSGGVIQGRIGNLSSANALRVTLMGLLAKTERKRIAYGRAITELSRLMLTALHEAGVYRTSEADRNVKLIWTDPLPIEERDLVAVSQAKRELGVPAAKVLRELGYAGTDAGVT